MSVKVCAPGRVNLLGEHVDYNGGFVLPAAIDLFLNLTACPAEDDVFTIRALDIDQQVSFRLDRLERKQTIANDPLPAWALYPAGVCWSLLRQGYTPRPVNAEFTSAIPAGAGLSSSAALETAFGLLWQRLGGWAMDRMRLAQICRDAEVQYVGVNCGIMDQFACLHGQEGCVLFLDTQTLRWEAIALPRAALVIAETGKAHRLGQPEGSDYNTRQAECGQALAILRQHLPQIRSLRDVLPQDLDRLEAVLPEVLRKRARHVVDECARVLSAVEYLRRADLRAFGELMYAGHASLRDLYEVSSPELDALVRIAADLPGCFGARLTGAGWGGSTINLVEAEAVETFSSALRERYAAETGLTVQVRTVHAARAAWAEEACGPQTHA